jgi:hypothetical protein
MDKWDVELRGRAKMESIRACAPRARLGSGSPLY